RAYLGRPDGGRGAIAIMSREMSRTQQISGDLAAAGAGAIETSPWHRRLGGVGTIVSRNPIVARGVGGWPGLRRALTVVRFGGAAPLTLRGRAQVSGRPDRASGRSAGAGRLMSGSS